MAKGGNGGSGSSTSGGGAGGSAYIADMPLIGLVYLDEGEQVTITVNTTLSSFGSLLSFSAGTAGGNAGYGGSGGSAGSKPTTSVADNAKIIYTNIPTITTRSLSGGAGYTSQSYHQDGNTGYDMYATIGGDGGRPAADKGNPGGSGGTGDSNFKTDKDGSMSVGNSTYAGSNGSAAKEGAVQVIYGNYKEA